MARPSSQRPRTAARTFGVVVLVVLLVAGAVAGYAEWLLRGGGAEEGGEVSAAAGAQAALVEQRLGELALAASDLAEQAAPALGEAPGAGPGAEGAGAEEAEQDLDLDPLLERLLDRLGFDLAMVAGPGGEMTAFAGADPAVGEAVAGSSVAVRALQDGQEDAGGRARGLWSRGESLWLVAAARVEGDGAPGGVPGGLAVVAEAVDRSLAVEARKLGRGETVFLAPAAGGGLAPAAGTLGRRATDELIPALREAGALEDGAAAVHLRLGGRGYRAHVTPLGGTGGGPRGAVVTLIPTDGTSPLLRRVQLVAAGAAAAALLLGGLLALAAGRGAARPLREVESAAELARAGDFAAAGRSAVPPALAAVFADLAEKRSLEKEVAEGLRGGLGTGTAAGAASGAGEAPERRRGAVLLAEMPRYARLRGEDEPREVAERLGRDLARVRRAVTGRGGRVEGALGHRVLAAFDGARAEARALAAGAAVLRLLSERENAFDEPVPPAVAVAGGEAVVGGPEGGRTVAGLPVQQVESLLREASSGDLILSKGVAGKLEEELRGAGIELAPRRGLLTPQPVYLLDAERAAAAAEALTGASAGGAPGRGSELARLARGTLFADRFELGERLAAGRTSVVYLARDRQTDGLVAVKALRRELLAAPGLLEAPTPDRLEAPTPDRPQAPTPDRPQAPTPDRRQAPGWDLRAVTGLAHPAVARVVDLGVHEGVPYVASQYVPGLSLVRLLADGGFLPPGAALRVARTLAAGLAAIHDSGFAHGDLRPETVILEPQGSLRIIDLGVAPLLPPPGTDPEADRALGDPRYLAPERLGGGEPSPPADVWAAGTLLVEVFTGRSLYGAPAEGGPGGEAGGASDGAAWDEMRDRVLAGPRQVPDPTELPEGLAQVLERCLEREPEARYPDGGALAADLGPIRVDVGKS